MNSEVYSPIHSRISIDVEAEDFYNFLMRVYWMGRLYTAPSRLYGPLQAIHSYQDDDTRRTKSVQSDVCIPDYRSGPLIGTYRINVKNM